MSYVFLSSDFIEETLEDFLVINVQMPISISRNIIEYTPLRNHIIVTNVSKCKFEKSFDSMFR